MVFAGRAKRVSDVRKATILGLLIAVTFYVIITFLALGALPQEQLLKTDKPLVEVLQMVLGTSGAYVMAGLGLISLAGSMIGWVLLSAEVPYQAARLKLFPPVFSKVNEQGTPVFALLCTCVMMQVLVFSVISKTMAGFYNFLILIATLASLIPYLIAVLFQLKLVWTGETYERRRQRIVDGIIASLACIYAVWIIVAGTADWRTFGLGVILIGLGLLVYPWVREKK
jgi:arginine:ornithine antiporter/lysine permease